METKAKTLMQTALAIVMAVKAGVSNFLMPSDVGFRNTGGRGSPGYGHRYGRTKAKRPNDGRWHMKFNR